MFWKKLWFNKSHIAEQNYTRSPSEQALQVLQEGNKRHVLGKQKHFKIEDPAHRTKIAIEGQKPIAVILGCSDSRVPVEIIFDKALGDLFVVRVAGNTCQLAELASIEFAVNYLNIPLVVVMGHTKCGAIQAATSNTPLSGSLSRLIQQIQPAVEVTRQENPELSGDLLIDKAVENNVWKSIGDLLGGSLSTFQAVRQNKIKIHGAIYDIKSGVVTWLGEHPNQKSFISFANQDSII